MVRKEKDLKRKNNEGRTLQMSEVVKAIVGKGEGMKRMKTSRGLVI